MTRLEEIRLAWSKNTAPKTKLILYFINGIPNMTYPGGEEAYNASITKYGGQTVYAPHNLWRQLFHMVVGAIVGVLTFGLYAAIVFGLLHELQCLRERLAHEGNELGLPKLFADWFFFSLGGLLVHKLAVLLWVLTSL